MGLVELPICKKDSLCMNQQQKTNVSKSKIARQLEYFSLHPYDLLCYFGTSRGVLLNFFLPQPIIHITTIL
jgi:hypothetical protein